MRYKTVDYDTITGEYYYDGKWWDSYPSEQIEADKAVADEYWGREQDRRRDVTDDI